MNLADRTGKRLKAIRKSKGLSQMEFAADLGIDRSYYSGIEKGKRNPSIGLIADVVHSTGLTLSDFFKDIENEDISGGFEVAEPQKVLKPSEK